MPYGGGYTEKSYVARSIRDLEHLTDTLGISYFNRGSTKRGCAVESLSGYKF